MGIEFADHRAYNSGDDIRRLDQHVYSRLGEYYVREYSLSQQLPVVILIDNSRSMKFGRPPKGPFSLSLAAALGYAALAGGDQLQIGAFSGSSVQWSPKFHGVWRASTLFSWLERLKPTGDTRIDIALRALLPRLQPEGLLFVISDWLFEGIDEILSKLAAAGQEVVGVQVLAPEEVSPERIGNGLLRLVDGETGREAEVGIDPASIDRYREEFNSWVSHIREQHMRQGWLFVESRSDDDLEQLITVDWRRRGLIV